MSAKNNKTLWIVVAILGVLTLLFVLSRQERKGGDSGDTAKVSADDWVKGDGRAGVTLIEYSDFQCPACASYEPVIKELMDKFGQQMKFVYRHFPLTQIHRNALPAARAAGAAGAQGKFWEMHARLFDKRGLW